RETLPRRRIGGRRLAEGEARELDEQILHRDIAAAGGVEQLRAGDRQRSVDGVRVDGAAAERGELEVTLAEGADHAIFRGGAGIDRQRQTGTGGVIVAVAVVLAEIAVPGRLAVRAAVEGDVGAQIAAELDAGVGAR